MQFRFSKGDPRAKALANFSWEKTSFSKQFRDAKIASEFLKIWDKLVVPHLKSNGEYKPPKAATATPTSSVTTPTASKRILEPQLLAAAAPLLPPSKKAKVQEDSDLTEAGATVDAEIEKCFIGKSSNFCAKY
jgi:hypothetical protein